MEWCPAMVIWTWTTYPRHVSTSRDLGWWTGHNVCGGCHRLARRMVEKLEWGADDLALMNQYGKRDSADWVWFKIEVRKELVNHLEKAILQQHLTIARRNRLHYDLTYVSTTSRWALRPHWQGPSLCAA